MTLVGPSPAELAGVRELAKKFGGDEAEEARLLALGRRVDAMLRGAAPEDDLGSLLRDFFAEQSGSLVTGGVNPDEEAERDDCEDVGLPAKSGGLTKGLMFMPGYRLAASLDVLKKQINALAPKRSKKSDGWIGDAAHASRASDHNPWVKDGNGIGVVTAIDVTHDPAGGMDCFVLASLLSGYAAPGRLSANSESGVRDPRIKYVIWNGRICSSEVQPWEWRKYTGKNPHNHHLHISVKPEPELYDSTEPWAL